VAGHGEQPRHLCAPGLTLFACRSGGGTCPHLIGTPPRERIEFVDRRRSVGVLGALGFGPSPGTWDAAGGDIKGSSRSNGGCCRHFPDQYLLKPS
jgi:hypothetical protein